MLAAAGLGVNAPPDSRDDNRIEQSLGRALQCRPLSDAALERIRARAFAEFQEVTALAARRRRLTLRLSIAASLFAVAFGTLVWNGAFEGAQSVARLDQAANGGVLMSNGQAAPHRAEPGVWLRNGDRWESRGPALAHLFSGGAMRIAEGTVVEAHSHGELQLTTGRVYLDFPPGAGHFLLRTSHGTIEHIGTRFEAVELNGRLRVRVREGHVVLRNDSSAEAVGVGMELIVERSGQITRGLYPPYGDDWEWVQEIVPPYEIENRPLAEFLTWVGQETGRHITFMDARAQEIAGRTTLHGSVRGMRPIDALNQVLSTTTLGFNVVGGEIRISSKPR
jgi:ferric-dicitrate binding protein FerR (iron transport regulator)